MFHKILLKLRTNKKRTVIYLVFLICLFLFITYPTPYEVLLPGGVGVADDFVTIENANPEEGEFYSTYVSVITKPSLFQYLTAKLNKGADIVPLGDYNKKLSVSEMNYASRIDKLNSIDTSLIVAYKKAGKDIQYDESGVIVAYRVYGFNMFEDIRVGDIITEVNGVPVKNKNDFIYETSKSSCNVDIKMKVFRDNKEMELMTQKTSIHNNDVCKLGINIYDYYTNFTSDPAFKVIDNSGYGSSAGLMQTLSVYNALTTEDLTHGLKIAGTGVISKDGTVLPISGIKQKVFGAIKNDVDIYFAPNITDGEGNNLYMQALEAKAIKNSTIQIVPVNSFDDALKFLQDYKK